MTDAMKQFVGILTICFIAGLNFGIWQHSINAGCFLFIVMLHLSVQLQITRR